jgi:chloramphenicol 3-O phosphotransferase
MIVLLNGASSSGKTTLARALQLRWPSPLLHLGIDTVLQMLPQSYVGMKPSARDGIEFYNDVDDRGPVVRVRSGPVGDNVQRSFARAVRLLADDGHDLVLDLVLLDRNSVSAYIDALQGHRTYFIGVHCDGAVLEARELARGDRFQNLARAQLRAVHEFRDFYDLEVDTSTRGPNDLASAILDFVARQTGPTGIARLHSTLVSEQPTRRSSGPRS